MAVTCFSTAPAVTVSALAIATLERPSAIRPSTSCSRTVRSCSGPGCSSAPKCATTSGSRGSPPAAPRPPGGERGAPRRDAPHGVDELARVADALLEQIADAAVPVGEQLRRVAGLDVLREHQHAEALDVAPGLDCRPQALVREARG